MAIQFEDTLGPGERVIYRTQFGYLDIAAQILYFAAFIYASWHVFTLTAGSLTSEEGGLPRGIITFMVLLLLFAKICKARIWVTNQRIHQIGGYASAGIVEVAIADVASVAFVYLGFGPAFGNVSLRLRDGGVVALAGEPRSQEICAAIAAQAGIPEPVRLGLKPIIISNLTVVGGFLTGFALAGRGFDWFPSIHDMIALLFFLLPIIFAAIIIGFILSSVTMLIVTRVALTADEARQLVCIGLDPHSDGKLQSLSRRWGRICELGLSLLDREPIRCRDLDREDGSHRADT